MFRGFAKYLIYSVNLVFTLIGLLITALGAFIVIKINQLKEAVPILGTNEYLQLAPYGVLVFGLIIFVVSFSGCCGTGMQVKWLLILYTVFLSILIALKLALVVLMFMADVKKATDATLTQSFDKNDGILQGCEAYFECCGTYGPESYNNTGNLVPYTCCKGYTGKESLTCYKDDAYPEGCLTKVAAKVSKFVRNTAISAIVIMAFECAFLGVTIYLIRTIKPKEGCKPEEDKTEKENS
ncbi:23 kDa integral membrane protein-like [Trichoplusia ni]|uniref:Tetraspanin n=1 Tax=Trichoplusia ni TaxID=7111 RepID=A0A7E5WRW6_TRINI|nr:23 kDa integral membrane protein-like [Trichoplusia ni]